MVKSAMRTHFSCLLGGGQWYIPTFWSTRSTRSTPGHIQQAAETRVPVADQRNGGQSAQRAHLEAALRGQIGICARKIMDLLGCVWIDSRAIQGKPNMFNLKSSLNISHDVIIEVKGI
jgi:hypothetical protein